MKVSKFTLHKIKDSFVARCISKRMYTPLKSFLREVEVKWGNVPTLAIARVKYPGKPTSKPVLLISREFVETHCKFDSDVGDLIFHEMLHHILRHLEAIDTEIGVEERVRWFAEDSIINAHLHSLDSARFMEKYYPDEVPYAFLRPNSKEFRPEQKGLKGPLDKFWARLHKKKIYGPLLKKYKAFYERLYELKVTREEAIEFFEKYFPKSPPQEKQSIVFLGGHGSGSSGSGNSEGEAAFGNGGKKDTKKSKEGGDGRSLGSVFDIDEIRQVLEILKLKEPDQATKNNFAQVIKRITTLSYKPGKLRHGTIYSKRIPAKLARRDLLTLERERYLFQRGDFKSQEVIIFFDYSGSMSEYQKFLIDLTKSLRRNDKKVRIVIWADGIKEISAEQFLEGKLPQVGYGTNGNVVAKFLKDEKVRQCVVVTDNMAGAITTKISARVFLVLVKHGTDKGSFADRSMVPDREIFWLEP